MHMKPAHSSQEIPLSEDLHQPQAQHASQRDRERVAASALCFMRMLGEPAEKKRRKKKKRRPAARAVQSTAEATSITCESG